MENTKNILGTAEVGQLLRKFAVPSIIAMLVGALYNIIDQFFIGQTIGTLGNAATNVAFPLSTSCVAIALLLGIGGASNFNLAMGRKQEEAAAYYVGNACTFLVGCGVVLCLVTEMFLTPMLRFFGSPDNILSYARSYVSITAIGFPFIIFATGGGHLVRADGSPKYMMLSNLIGAAINTILDALFIIGLRMGMEGAALATIIGQICSGLLVASYLRKYKTVSLERRHLIPQRRYIQAVVSLGTAPFFNQLAMMVVQVAMNQSLNYYGRQSQYGDSIPLACAGIISKVGMLFFGILIGISQGTQPIVSYNYGAEKYNRVKEVYLLAIKVGGIISVATFLLFQIFPRQIISMFGSGDEMYYQFAVMYFRVYLFATFLNFVQPITSNFFTAIGKPQKGVFLSLTRQIIFLLPLILILPLVMGIDGIMYAAPIADLSAAAICAVMIRKEFKKMGTVKA